MTTDSATPETLMTDTHNEAGKAPVCWSKAIAIAAALIGSGYVVRSVTGGSAVDWQIATLAYVSAILFYVTAPYKAGPIAGGVLAVAAIASLAILHAYPPDGAGHGSTAEIAKIYLANGASAAAMAWVIRKIAARYGH